MKKETLFARHGFLQSDLIDGLTGEKSKIGTFLQGALDHLTNNLQLSQDIEQDAWSEALEHASQNVERIGGEMLIDPTKQELPLAELDRYIRGIVRWLNELGIHTTGCCDGHNSRPAVVHFKSHLTNTQIRILKACTLPEVKIRIEGKRAGFYYNPGEAHKLLDIAERLFTLVKDPKNIIELEAGFFKSKMIDLLSISGASGNERRFRNYMRQKLNSLTDYTYMDRAGNLLAYLYCGDGPTVLLSAHMDTVEEFEPGRIILEEGTTLTSSKGILGADDRAGIAVILETLSRIGKTNFNGTVKVALTVKEEIGCVGSRAIDPEFIEDVDGAIVVDRRGKRDIVTSNGGVSFCPVGYGELFEEAGRLAGMRDWKMTAGGLSDAKVFASYGIPSVNLSAGYWNEHSDLEVVDYRATYETVKLVEGVLNHQLIPFKEENWVNVI
ncbi:M20/M25/M40 family metallo-hydrolase [Alkalihalophilus lindianensis]|uniref:M20/M25/M40 family metallo-hydrolase n=1 Tax=Alkalihalophilus lindianensis TaxID=1630542 RepID=A0ABU3XF23_9BACI|nr:M20/M25/M40 family metallo-hydrolase [Alkalihalophilus lindianensis]MDV2686484.1 M20/M25/M40 family metallo-hydrolase [Alkalihalophilus lindianensis]